MKMLKPVEQSDIPPSASRSTEYGLLYEKALALNGRVLPVEFADIILAMNFTSQFKGAGQGRKLGLVSKRRGSVVYIFKDVP